MPRSVRNKMAWKTLLLSYTFACLENEESPIAVLGIPLDVSSTYRPGSRYAPQKIRDAACNIELYSLAAGTVIEDTGFKDYGDLVLPPGDVGIALDRIEFVTKSIVKEHAGLMVVLGGEHLLTYSMVRALKNNIDTLVVFDAHLDARNEYLGSTLNHATFLRKLVEDGTKVVHIGSRAYSKEELEYISSKDVKVIGVLEALKGEVDLNDLNKVYISIDMDVFDPSIAPGVSNPEPFGLNHFEFMRVLKKIFEKSSEVVALDIVELNPLVDVGDVTSILAAKIVIEASGLYLKRREVSRIK
ncbi:MAG: agmatinase [Desulfurococcaceae archaeon]